MKYLRGLYFRLHNDSEEIHRPSLVLKIIMKYSLCPESTLFSGSDSAQIPKDIRKEATTKSLRLRKGYGGLIRTSRANLAVGYQVLRSESTNPTSMIQYFSDNSNYTSTLLPGIPRKLFFKGNPSLFTQKLKDIA